MLVSKYYYWIDSLKIKYVVKMLLENDICWIKGSRMNLKIANLCSPILFSEKLAKNDTHVLLQVSLRLKRLEKGRN